MGYETPSTRMEHDKMYLFRKERDLTMWKLASSIITFRDDTRYVLALCY